jgi:nuclear transport factor 2 (NTF2) superfamily protein
MSTPTGQGSSFRALIVIPGTVNYFYNQSGRRIGEALQALGGAVDICTLAECPDQDYDWCIFSNLTEVLVAAGEEQGARRIAALARHWRHSASCAIDCVRTVWYERIWEYCHRCGIEWILDLGLCDQSSYLAADRRDNYRFVFSGLTPSEQAILEDLPHRETPRAFPWAFVGHKTPYRVALVDHLIQSVDPGGFIYMPSPAPYTEQGSPHLNQQKFEMVLRQTRYQIWCSHHRHFYMEPERFRMSLLTGSVPIKVLDSCEEVPPEACFKYLMMEAAEVGQRLQNGDFQRVRERFWCDWRRAPLLSTELGRILGLTSSGANSARQRAA